MKSQTQYIVLGGILLAASSIATAEMAPVASDISPEVYTVIAENEQFRVLRAVWQPGQEDKYHSHPGDRVSLYETDCHLRLFTPDGKHRDGKPKAGTARARTGSPMYSHKAKNMGDQVCIIHIVELK